MVFVIIDGLDASGKSTQAILLASFLKRQRYSVFLRIHPSHDNLFGRQTLLFLRQRGKRARFSASLFYMLDVLRSVILYSRRSYDFIVFVRYIMGTAYLPSPLHRVTYRFFSLIVPLSKEKFFLDIPPDEGYRRAFNRNGGTEMFENLEDFQKIRHKALSLALENKWIILDAKPPRKEIQEEIRRHLETE
jgi:dTMP kinase